MKFLENLTRKPNTFQRTIGLTLQQFDLLAEQLVPHWKKTEEQRKFSHPRKRAIGAGHPYKFQSLRDKLLIVLFYYKTYATQEIMGVILGIHQANISRLLQKMLPLIEETADPELVTYLERVKKEYAAAEKISNFAQFFEQYPHLREAATDATEQQCFRSKNYEKQKIHYSGKKSKHTLKTQISVASTGRILDVSETYPGSVHDKTIIDQEETVKKFPKKSCQRFDSGYQGIKQKNPDHYIVLPTKKQRGQELSKLAKEHNRVNSKRRVVAEHVFSRLKKFRICGNLYRGCLESYNQIFRNIAAILNFKLINPSIIM
jgi:hypothetical protein